MRLYYMAHPVAAYGGVSVPENLARAKRWLAWLSTTFQEIAFVAPWISEVEANGDANAAQRAHALAQDCEIVSRCDGLVLVSNRVSSGMAQERGSAKDVIDFTVHGYTDPDEIEAGAARWLAARFAEAEADPRGMAHEGSCPCRACEDRRPLDWSSTRGAPDGLDSDEVDAIVTRASGGQAEPRRPQRCPHGVLLLDCAPCTQLAVEAREAQAAKPLVIGGPEDREARRQYLHRSATTDGQPPRPGFEHASAPGPLKANGQHEAYWVLPEAERARGFVRPVRRRYKHEKCGAITTMGDALAETYARDFSFYNSTFCVACGAHFPVGANGEFTWYHSTEKVGT